MHQIFDPPPILRPHDLTRSEALSLARDIMNASADYYAIDRIAAKGRRLTRTIDARHVASFVIRELTHLSFPTIGRLLDGQHHTTVLSAHARVSARPDLRRAATDVALACGVYL